MGELSVRMVLCPCVRAVLLSGMGELSVRMVLCPCVRAVLLSDMGELCGSAQIKGWLKLEPRLAPAGSHTV